ncbi:unnamed protein product [Orchesella dallaii]|uniref:Poly(ADP-ribose) glycohydrolase ARH3 n=1 Tax=Orchesella dallaii TaxID=48710 RepID=A0ABP1RAT1_9HEXA
MFDKGAAIGDGVGLATEFMGTEQARILYGNGPIKFGNDEGHEFWRDACRNGWFESDFTDDTDQQLLITQCLLADKGTLDPANFAFRIEEWKRLGLPELENKLPNGMGFTVFSAISQKNFLSDPLRASYEVWNKGHRNFAANGAVMRTAILGATSFWNEQKVAENCMMAAKVTHADPRCVVSAVIVGVMISRLLRGSAASQSLPFKEDYEKHLVEMIQYGSKEESSYIEKVSNCPKAIPKKIDTPLHRLLIRGIRRFAARVTGLEVHPKFELEDFNIPSYPHVDIKRYDNPVPIRPNVKKMDDFGIDKDMMDLCRDVVDKYKFLVEDHPLCPSAEQISSQTEKELAEDAGTSTWVDQLYAHSFPESLSCLNLNERNKIGYTFKCLGAGLYAVTRKQPEDMSSGEFYKHIITELTLETGDADTNCAVAGAVLGCRLGKSGLPSGWVNGVRHHDFLEDITNKLCDMILEGLRNNE